MKKERVYRLKEFSITLYISKSLLLLMEKKHYVDISIGEITNKAGVNRSTYYRNFSSKEEIIKFYFEHIMNQYLMAYETLDNKSFEAYLATLFQHFYQYKTSLLLLYRNDVSYLLLAVLNSFFAKMQAEKFIYHQEQFHLYYHIGGIYNFFVLWFSHAMKETPNELTAIAVSMFPVDKTPGLFT